MSNRRITELPAYQAPEEFTDMAVISTDSQTKRVFIGEHIYDTEGEAIAKVKEIFASGRKVFILPVK